MKDFYKTYTSDVCKYIIGNVHVDLRQNVQDVILKQFGLFTDNVKKATSAVRFELEDLKNL